MRRRRVETGLACLRIRPLIMTQNRTNQPRRSFIADLCAHMSEEEIAAAEDRFRRYVEIVRRIHEYVEEQSADAKHLADDTADSS